MSYYNFDPYPFEHKPRENTSYCAKCGAWLNKDDPDNAVYFACATAIYPYGRKFRLFEPETRARIDYRAWNMDHALIQAERWLARKFGERRTVAYVTELVNGMPDGRSAVAYSPIASERIDWVEARTK